MEYLKINTFTKAYVCYNLYKFCPADGNYKIVPNIYIENEVHVSKN
jgi:hypothetical protein